MSAIPLAVRQGTDAWLEARRDAIGSSDIPVITGSRPGGLLNLWAIKSRLLEPEPPDEDTQELFDLGHALEPVIAARYSLKQNRPVRVVNRMLQHPSIPWATASLDRVSAVKGERRVVELKWAPFSRDWSGDEPVPALVQDQVQWQLMVTGYPVADVAVLRNGRVEVHELTADQSYQDDLVFLARDFRGYVLRGERPPVDGSESTRRVLTRLYPRDLGTITEPTAEIDALVAELREAKVALKAAEDHEATLKNVLRATLETAPGVEGDGYRITFKKNKDSETVAWEQVAKGLLATLPDETQAALLSIHTTPKEGARPLVVKYRDEETGKWT